MSALGLVTIVARFLRRHIRIVVPLVVVMVIVIRFHAGSSSSPRYVAIPPTTTVGGVATLPVPSNANQSETTIPIPSTTTTTINDRPNQVAPPPATYPADGPASADDDDAGPQSYTATPDDIANQFAVAYLSYRFDDKPTGRAEHVKALTSSELYAQLAAEPLAATTAQARLVNAEFGSVRIADRDPSLPDPTAGNAMQITVTATIFVTGRAGNTTTQHTLMLVLGHTSGQWLVTGIAGES